VKVIWTEPAYQDVLCIGEFIEAENPKAAHKVVGEIYALASSLKTMAKRYRSGSIKGTYEAVYINWNIIYSVSDDVNILAVVDTRKAHPVGSDREKTILELLQ